MPTHDHKKDSKGSSGSNDKNKRSSSVPSHVDPATHSDNKYTKGDNSFKNKDLENVSSGVTDKDEETECSSNVAPYLRSVNGSG